MRYIVKLLLIAVVIAISPELSSDITVDGFGGAIVASLVYGVLFVLIGWAIALGVTLLSIVPGVLTLGLFFLLIPALVGMVLLKMTAGLVGSFEIRSWSAALLLSIAIGVVNYLLDARREP